MFRTAAFTAVGLCLLALPIQSRAANGPIHIPALARVTRSQRTSAAGQLLGLRGPHGYFDAHCRREHPRDHGQAHRRSLRAGVSREFNRERKSQTQMCSQQPVHAIRAAVDHHAAAARGSRARRQLEI